MAVTLILGTQWGDEGKGKIIDALSGTADYVVRFHGGNNAGHTVVNQFGTFPLHLVPSGIFSKKALGFITNGVVLDLEVLIFEISQLEDAGIRLKNRLYISPRCHIIMPYHKILDKLYEDAKGKAKTGTTGRGIGPVYADKVSYNGIRIADLLNPDQLKIKLETQLSIKNKIIQSFGQRPLRKKDILDNLMPLKNMLLPFIKEPFPYLQRGLLQKKQILLEGAQAVLLDNDWGTYPYVTASTVVAGGVTAGAGIPPNALNTIIGVAKAYATRVGEGPFPTELINKTGEKLRKLGAEFGTTTGRPRRCGWIDTELMRFVAQINGLTFLAITKLDILDDFEEVQLCTGYTWKGKKVHYYDGDATFLSEVTPVYKTMKGWKSSTKSIKKYGDLPVNAKKYLEEIERQANVPIKYISTGKEREALIRK